MENMQNQNKYVFPFRCKGTFIKAPFIVKRDGKDDLIIATPEFEFLSLDLADLCHHINSLDLTNIRKLNINV